MSLRNICKEWGKHPLKALFFFPVEDKTSRASTKFMVEKDLELREQLEVYVNWNGRKTFSKIVALDGKLLTDPNVFNETASFPILKEARSLEYVVVLKM